MAQKFSPRRDVTIAATDTFEVAVSAKLLEETFAKSVAALEEVALLAKSHVSSYTRSDGTFVAEHDDKRVAKQSSPAKPKSKAISLKQGNVALVAPLDATKSDFGDYQIHHPAMPSGSFVPAKSLTVKNGKVVGMMPALAKKLGVETVGDVQDKTELTKQKEKQKADDAAKKQASVDKQAKFIGGTLALSASLNSGKISLEEANKRLAELKAEYESS